MKNKGLRGANLENKGFGGANLIKKPLLTQKRSKKGFIKVFPALRVGCAKQCLFLLYVGRYTTDRVYLGAPVDIPWDPVAEDLNNPEADVPYGYVDLSWSLGGWLSEYRGMGNSVPRYPVGASLRRVLRRKRAAQPNLRKLAQKTRMRNFPASRRSVGRTATIHAARHRHPPALEW